MTLCDREHTKNNLILILLGSVHIAWMCVLVLYTSSACKSSCLHIVSSKSNGKNNTSTQQRCTLTITINTHIKKNTKSLDELSRSVRLSWNSRMIDYRFKNRHSSLHMVIIHTRNASNRTTRKTTDIFNASTHTQHSEVKKKRAAATV